MANINKNHIMRIDVANATLNGGGFSFYITDKNTSNLFVELVVNTSNNPLIGKFVAIEQASDYMITLVMIKPDKEILYIDGELLEEERLFHFNFSREELNQIGAFKCEFRIKCLVNGVEEVRTTAPFGFDVLPSIVTDLDGEAVKVEVFPIYEELLERLNNLEEGLLVGYATEEYVDEAIKKIDVTDQLTSYATRDYVDSEISTIELTPGPQGPKGDTGATGTTPTIKAGTVTTGNAGTSASVTASTSGTTTTFNFTIPRGATGPQGPKGDTGATGIQGPQGPKGNDGLDYILTSSDKEEIAKQVPYVKVAEQPICVNSIKEMTDTSKMYVLNSTGTFYAYMKKEIVVEGSKIPNFTNLLETGEAYTKVGKRFSQSSAAWKDNSGGTGYIVAIPKGTVTIRIKNYCAHNYNYMYLGTGENSFAGTVSDATEIEKLTKENQEIAVTFTNNSYNYATFVSRDGYVEIITVNEEITYTTTEAGTQIIEEWANTGISYNQPASYESRVIANEQNIADLKNKTASLENRMSSLGTGSNGSSNGMTAFSTPAYPPVPQLPADGSEGSDFNVNTMTTQKAYDYMDALCNKHTQYITKQTMGKDASGTYDHNRYILCKAYWRAWQKENYPIMYAWANGDTIIYSVSVSPRVGDDMYSTKYVGTVYAKVTSVNCIAGTLSTRTVNGLIFTRYEEGDIEPTVAYTQPPSSPGAFINQVVYNSSFSSLTKVSTAEKHSFVGADGITYIRYPFEDRKRDKTKPLSIFILANEHGYKGDDLIPSLTVMRIAKDLCKNTENTFLKWMKENCMITMIPVGSPWGYARYLENESSGYYNYNGVNINRNYDTPGWANSDANYGDVDTFGPYAGSENETQHIMNTMRLCKPNVGMSCHSPGFGSEFKDMPDNAYFIHQGQGYDRDRIKNIAETLYSNYGMGCGGSNDTAQHYNNCGKSPAYIQYAGAVGGLIEIVPQENNTNNTHTSIAMEQSYAQILLFLQTWCKEALEK